MFLNITKYVLHITIKIWIIVVIMICAASVSVASSWEFHVHHGLV